MPPKPPIEHLEKIFNDAADAKGFTKVNKTFPFLSSLTLECNPVIFLFVFVGKIVYSHRPNVLFSEVQVMTTLIYDFMNNKILI